WDSNPRYSKGVNRISSPAHSTTLPPLRYAARREVYLRSLYRTEHGCSVHVGLQRDRHVDAAVGALIILQNRDQRAANGEARTVQRMHKLGLALRVLESRLHPARLERFAIGTRRNFAICALTRQPHFQV